MKRSKLGVFVSFTDMSLLLAFLFICVAGLEIIFMAPKVEKQKKVDAKAEFIITMEWANESDDDVDIYLEDPIGNLSFFRAREVGLMHLDRDDLGSKNDTIQLADGTLYEVKENRETLTIRGIIPGEYTLNAHMYLRKDKGEKTKVKIKMVKVNPVVKVVMIKEIELCQSGDEITAFRFKLDKAGDITDINFLQKELAVGETTPNWDRSALPSPNYDDDSGYPPGYGPNE